jgi:N utilization substance protein A
MAVSANRLELLQIAEAVAREKSINREVVIEAMEDAIQKAAKSRYGSENEIQAKIDPVTGEIKLSRLLEVVETVVNEATEITLKAAKRAQKDIEVGQVLAEDLPPLDFGRVAAQNAKQVIVQKVRDAERERQYEEYRDRIGEVANGTVKRVEYGNVVVDLGRAEAIVRRDESLPRENFRYGDRVRAYIYDVRREQRGPQIFLSRTRPEFMAKLFAQEVPEIYDNIVNIKSVARDPGSRAKIAVLSQDSSIDPVGACVGMRGSRVQAVSGELGNERVDIILWDDNPAQLVINAMAPAEVESIVVDEDTHTMDVGVADDNLAQAIGRAGQNVRLAGQLTGWTINVMSIEEMGAKHEQESGQVISYFVDALDVGEDIAEVLVEEGFTTLEEVAYVPLEEMMSIEGFDEELAQELRARAKDALLTQAIASEEKLDSAEPAEDLLTMEGMERHLAFILASRGVVTMEDLAEQAVEDLLDIEDMTEERAGELIMTARAPWFADEDESAK